MSLTTRCTPMASTSTTATCAPSRATRSAPARPMPEAEAVTIPILPASRMLSSLPDGGPRAPILYRGRGDRFVGVDDGGPEHADRAQRQRHAQPHAHEHGPRGGA